MSFAKKDGRAMNRLRKYMVICSGVAAFFGGLAIWSPAAPQSRAGAAPQTSGIAPTTVEWAAYRGDPSGSQFADLGQINLLHDAP